MRAHSRKLLCDRAILQSSTLKQFNTRDTTASVGGCSLSLGERVGVRANNLSNRMLRF